MSDTEATPNPVARSWDTYWQGAEGRAAYSAGGTGHPLILDFWKTYFSGTSARFNTPSIIDIASGNGALVEHVGRAFATAPAEITCLDISAAAIAVLENRFPGVRGMVADARNIPVKSASFDMAVSQFGLEYAGLDAIGELARIVAADGEIALLLHYRDGAVHQQCAQSLQAVSMLGRARFFPRAIRMFEAGFAAVRGADRREYDAAAQAMIPTLREMETIMTTYGRHVADDTVSRLYTDIRAMHQRMQYYEPSDVLNWLVAMEVEVDAYEGRMQSMCDAAVDFAGFDSLCGALQGAGFSIVRREPLVDLSSGAPLAWALVATNGQSG
ncbi:MAG: class I SAM-dependent methyltransferase [Woeseia sp.]